MDDRVFDEAAREQGASEQAARRVLGELRAQLGSGPFFVYRIGSGSGSAGGEGGSTKQRTLFAFRSGDDALSFAQRNRLGPAPRLLRLDLAQILTIILHRPNVEAVLFVAAVGDHVRPGQRPEGQRVARAEVLAALTKDETDT